MILSSNNVLIKTSHLYLTGNHKLNTITHSRYIKKMYELYYCCVANTKKLLFGSPVEITVGEACLLVGVTMPAKVRRLREKM